MIYHENKKGIAVFFRAEPLAKASWQAIPAVLVRIQASDFAGITESGNSTQVWFSLFNVAITLRVMSPRFDIRVPNSDASFKHPRQVLFATVWVRPVTVEIKARLDGARRLLCQLNHG